MSNEQTIPINTATVLSTIKNDTKSVMLIDLLSKVIIADDRFNVQINGLIQENNFLKERVGDLSDRLNILEMGEPLEAEVIELDDEDADSNKKDDSD